MTPVAHARVSSFHIKKKILKEKSLQRKIFTFVANASVAHVADNLFSVKIVKFAPFFGLIDYYK